MKQHHGISLHLNLAKKAHVSFLCWLLFVFFKAIPDLARERCLDFLISGDQKGQHLSACQAPDKLGMLGLSRPASASHNMHTSKGKINSFTPLARRRTSASLNPHTAASRLEEEGSGG